MRTQSQNTTVFVLAVIGSLVLLNIVGLRAFLRFDVTRDNAYTLSQASKDAVNNLKEPLTITAYFTEKLPAPYSSNARYLRDLLEEYRSASKGKLRYEFIDPMSKEEKAEIKQDVFGRSFREATSMEREIMGDGIQPVEIRVVEQDEMQTKRAYMGVVLKSDEKKEVIPVVQNVATLEYDLTTLIRKLTRTKAPVIAVLQGHEEPKLEEKLRRLHSVLSQQYEVRPLDLSSKEQVDEDVDAVLVIGPKTALKPGELKALDQFLMRGKSVGFFLDAVQVDVKTFQPTDVEHGLTAMLESYGVKVGNALVADVQSAQLNVQERRGFMMIAMPVPYPFIPQLLKLEGDSPVSKGLVGVSVPFTTQVTATAADGRQVAVLAKSSAKSWLEQKPYNLDPRRDWRSETINPAGPYDLMVQVSGKLKSHFASEATSQLSSGAPVIAESQGEPRIIVAGGSQLFWDDFMSPQNQALALNVADWLLLDQALLAMRTRGLVEPPLQPELSSAKRNGVKLGNAFGIPLVLALVGIIRWRLRESKRPSITV